MSDFTTAGEGAISGMGSLTYCCYNLIAITQLQPCAEIAYRLDSGKGFHQQLLRIWLPGTCCLNLNFQGLVEEICPLNSKSVQYFEFVSSIFKQTGFWGKSRTDVMNWDGAGQCRWVSALELWPLFLVASMLVASLGTHRSYFWFPHDVQ